MYKIKLLGGPLDGKEIDGDGSMNSDFFVNVNESQRARYHYNGNGTANHLGTEKTPTPEAVTATAPEPSAIAGPEENQEPDPIFPRIKRNLFDVLHDDERNEVWIGLKLRQTVKGRTRENGPIEDVELNVSEMATMVALDSMKAEVLMALARDAQLLNEKRQRQAALKGNGVLDRLSAGLGRAFAGKPS